MKKKTVLKKLLALSLCASLSLTLLSGAALAVETFTASEACIALDRKSVV